MFKINSIDIATPTAYEIGIASIDKAERNANGTMIIENIATKRKLNLAWDIITNTDLQTILQQVNASRFVDVEYLDSETQTLTTGTFYTGDRMVGATPLYQSGTLSHWRNLNFSFIEQ